MRLVDKNISNAWRKSGYFNIETSAIISKYDTPNVYSVFFTRRADNFIPHLLVEKLPCWPRNFCGIPKERRRVALPFEFSNIRIAGSVEANAAQLPQIAEIRRYVGMR